VYILGFYVWNDGDFWSDGDFAYDITVDWGVDRKNFNMSEVKASSGSWIPIQETVKFDLPKKEGTFFNIYSDLYEDSNLLGKMDVNFNFPWDENEMNPDILTIDGVDYNVFSKYMKFSDDLDATFYVQIINNNQKSLSKKK